MRETRPERIEIYHDLKMKIMDVLLEHDHAANITVLSAVTSMYAHLIHVSEKDFLEVMKQTYYAEKGNVELMMKTIKEKEE